MGQQLTPFLNGGQSAHGRTAPGTAGQSVHLFGTQLIGATPNNLHKLLLTAGFILIAYLIALALRAFLGLFVGSRTGTRFRFWAKQGVSLVLAAIMVVGILSIWFDNPAQLAAVVAVIGAGVAFALQRVITAFAGYIIILRGKTFSVGDRIVMDGVRGDVIDLSFMQTRIMEMGQSPKEQGDGPTTWITSRQFTGRVVTVTNDKVFDSPVYNYTREFPYVWDELKLPVKYDEDVDAVERLLLDSARRHALTREKIGNDEVKKIETSFGIDIGDVDPWVYWRLTEKWLEITVRFLCPDHGIRKIKDGMNREIVRGLNNAKIRIAAGEYGSLHGEAR